MSLSARYFSPLYWPTWLGLGLLRLLCYLPYSWQMAFGRLLGRVSYYIAPSRRHIADVNLRLCFPNLSASGRRALLKENFRSVGCGIVEMALGWWLPEQRLQKMTKLVGEHHLQAALASGKGVLLIGAHFTTLDLIGRLLVQHCPTLCTTYRASKNKLANTIMTARRDKTYFRSLDRDQMRQFVRALKEGYPVWYAPDQDYGRKVSVFAPFFGTPAASITTTARLIKLTGATVIPMYQYRLPDNKGYEIQFSPPLEGFPSGDEVADAKRINQIIEAGISKSPEQYLWQHRRFKTRPEGEDRPY